MRHICSIACAMLLAAALTPAAGPGPTSSEVRVLDGTVILRDVYRPSRIAVSRRGELFILSRSDHSIVRARRQAGTYQVAGRIGVIGKGPGELLNPTDVTVADDDSIWVADQGNARISGFTAEGKPLSQFSVPAPIAVAASGDRIVTVSTFNPELATVWSRDGQKVGTLGYPPLDSPGFDAAHKAYNSRAHVFGSDQGVYLVFRSLVPPRIHLYNVSGQLLKDIPVRSPEIDALVPAAIAAANLPIQFRYSTVMNSAARHPSGDLWIALPAPTILRLNAVGGIIGKYEINVGRTYRPGVHALAFVDKDELIAVAEGLGVVQVKVPR